VLRRTFGLLCVLIGCTTALAQLPWNAPDSEKTTALSLKGNVDRGEAAFVICQGCHRVGALGRLDGSYPSLAGQHATVLVKQLVDVRSGRRNNPKMLPFADHQALSVQDIADIAVYLQLLPVPPDHGRGDGKYLTQGQQLYERDCAACHAPNGMGDASRFFPRISGQHYRYLVRESQMIRSGERRNGNPDMISAISHYSDQEIAAVADYVTRLPVRENAD